jgi:hypothetical protein
MSWLQIPFINRLLPIEIPERNPIFELEPAALPPAANFERPSCRTPAEPVNLSPPAKLVHPGQKVIIIADDNTRCIPVTRIIPVALNAFNECLSPAPCVGLGFRHVFPHELNVNAARQLAEAPDPKSCPSSSNPLLDGRRK